MKKMFMLLVILMHMLSSHAQTDSLTVCNRDSLIQEISTRLDVIFGIEYLEACSQNYKLYETENMYNFLLLDSKTGLIQQLQWSLKEDEEFRIYINREILSSNVGKVGCGTFELYPTKNMYQFILLDKDTGRTWHVQWGMSPEKRWIRRIY